MLSECRCLGKSWERSNGFAAVTVTYADDGDYDGSDEGFAVAVVYDEQNRTHVASNCRLQCFTIIRSAWLTERHGWKMATVGSERAIEKFAHRFPSSCLPASLPACRSAWLECFLTALRGRRASRQPVGRFYQSVSKSAARSVTHSADRSMARNKH